MTWPQNITSTIAGIMLLCWVQGVAQNPFELTPRLNKIEAPATFSDNPFDLVTVKEQASNPVVPVSIEVPQATDQETDLFNRFKFLLISFFFLYLAFLMTALRQWAGKMYSAFLGDNMMNQLLRERDARGLAPFIPYYIFFFLNAGAFCFFLLHHFEGTPVMPNWQQWAMLTLSFSAAVVLKHFLLAAIGYVFPVQKEIHRYNFLIMVFWIVLSFVLFPINILMAYLPGEGIQAVLIASAILGGGVYAFRVLRGLLIANGYVLMYSFHFLLYICTVEIAPVMVVYKLITNQF